MALAYLTINLDDFTGDDHPPVPSYSTITLDPGVDHIDAAADVIHVRTIVVSLDRQGKAATANGVPCVDGKVPVVAGVAYAVSAPNVLRGGPHYIPALTAGQVVDLSDYITPGAPLTPDQAAALAARVTALEATPPGSGVTDHGALTGLSDDDHPIYLTTGRGDARYVQGTDPRLSDARTPTAHTHTSAQVTDLTEAVQDAVAALLVGASGVTLSYDDAANTLTITGPGASGLDAEAVRDAIGVALIGTGLISVAVNDAADTITISTTATANATDAALRDRTTHTGTQAISTVTGLQAALDGKAPSVHTHTAAQVSDSTTTGRALVTATDAAAARGTLGLGTAATTASTDYATAAQGALAGTALQDAATAGTVHALAPGPTWYNLAPGPQGTYADLVDQKWLHPYWLPTACTMDRIAINVTAASAGALTRMAIYTLGADGASFDLLHNLGTVDCSTTGTKTISGSWAFPAGTFWLAHKREVGGCTYTTSQSVAGPGPMPLLSGADVAQFGKALHGLRETGSTDGSPYPSTLSTFLDWGAVSIAYRPALAVRFA